MQEKIRSIIESATDVSEASRMLEEEARKDADLYNHLTEPFLARACYDAVRTEYQSERKQIWTAPNYTEGGNGHRVKEHARTLLDFPLPNGKRMRDATKADLLEASEFYRKQAADMARKARWLEQVAESVGKKKVGNALSAEDLEQMRSQYEAA